MKYEYKTVIYKEGLFSSVILGDSKVDPERLSETLNQFGRQGWRVAPWSAKAAAPSYSSTVKHF